MIFGDCPKCERKNTRMTVGFCHNCYRRFIWKRKLIKCKRCGRMKPNQAKGYCQGCYNFIFHSEGNKAILYKKWHNIDLETYKRKTEKCILCDFNKIVDLHHLDENKQNNANENLVGLCPNHHKMLHDYRYKFEILQQLKEKGFKVPEFKKEMSTGYFKN